MWKVAGLGTLVCCIAAHAAAGSEPASGVSKGASVDPRLIGGSAPIRAAAWQPAAPHSAPVGDPAKGGMTAARLDRVSHVPRPSGLIRGSVPILSSLFTMGPVLADRSAVSFRADGGEPIASAKRDAAANPGDMIPAPDAWVQPLVDRHVGIADKKGELSADFRDVILIVEGMYDPVRLDGTGQIPRMIVRPGTASMNNVFADRWSVADSDENVDYRVGYIAQAWQKHDIVTCDAFEKRRFIGGRIVRSGLYRSDCNRLQGLVKDRDDLFAPTRIVAAPLDVPVFAAPPPGARLSTQDFWIAQESRIAMIKEALKFKRQGVPLGGITR